MWSGTLEMPPPFGLNFSTLSPHLSILFFSFSSNCVFLKQQMGGTLQPAHPVTRFCFVFFFRKEKAYPGKAWLLKKWGRELHGQGTNKLLPVGWDACLPLAVAPLGVGRGHKATGFTPVWEHNGSKGNGALLPHLEHSILETGMHTQIPGTPLGAGTLCVHSCAASQMAI
jgi:hypothetical protein